jgi:tellurite resistance protein TehA-like permease
MTWGVSAFFFLLLYPLIVLRVAFQTPLLKRRRPQVFIFLGATCLIFNGFFVNSKFEHGLVSLPSDGVNALYGLVLFIGILVGKLRTVFLVVCLCLRLRSGSMLYT